MRILTRVILNELPNLIDRIVGLSKSLTELLFSLTDHLLVIFFNIQTTRNQEFILKVIILVYSFFGDSKSINESI